jgi:transcriptional regulator with XRE-family HTH domain
VPNYIDRHIGAKLREFRSRKNLSPPELGDAAGLGASDIEAYESAARRLPAPAMLELCRALCISPQDLFEDLELRPPRPAAMPAQLEELLQEREFGRW